MGKRRFMNVTSHPVARAYDAACSGITRGGELIDEPRNQRLLSRLESPM